MATANSDAALKRQGTQSLEKVTLYSFFASSHSTAQAPSSVMAPHCGHVDATAPSCDYFVRLLTCGSFRLVPRMISRRRGEMVYGLPVRAKESVGGVSFAADATRNSTAPEVSRIEIYGRDPL
jgi:hypothetical protein